jgi:hypothetical protein
MNYAPTNDELDRYIIDSEEPNGERMLAEVYKFLGRFVAYPSEHARVAHALWIVHTHLMDKWDSTPRIAFLSAEPSSGKTRALEISELLVPNPVCTVNSTPAYLIRKVGEGSVTVLFDEIDAVFGPKAKEHEDIRAWINAGHRRGATSGRCSTEGKKIVTEDISAFAPVALAGLGWLPDTILTRSVVIRMRRRHAGEHVEQYRRRIHSPQGAGIRLLIERWAQSAEINWPELPPEIQDRDADAWEPLIAVADAIGCVWPTRARKAAIALVTEAKDRDPSLGIRLLADLRTVFGDETEMHSKAILAALVALPESPWADMRGKPLDERGLAHRLRQYAVRPKVIKIGTHTPRGYAKADLIDAWSRYLAPLSATSETSATTQVNQGANVADVADAEIIRNRTNPNKTYTVADVADVALVCAQCGGADDGTLEAHEGHMLHPECVRFWSNSKGSHENGDDASKLILGSCSQRTSTADRTPLQILRQRV